MRVVKKFQNPSGPIVVSDNTRVAPVYVPTLEELYARQHPVSTYVEKVQPVVTTYVEQGPAVKQINKKAEDSYKNKIIEQQNQEKVAQTLDWMGNTLNKFFPNQIVGGIVRGQSPYDYISYGNPGIVTTAFAQENPEAAEAVNLVFDFAGPGLASKIPGLVTKGARIMTGTPFRIGNSMYRVRPVRNRLYSGVPMPFEIEKYQPGKLKPGDEVVNQFGLKGIFVKDFNLNGEMVPMVKVGDRTFVNFPKMEPNKIPEQSAAIRYQQASAITKDMNTNSNIMKEAERAARLEQRKQDKPVEDIIRQFNDDGIYGFDIASWKAARAGFGGTTKKQLATYKNHIPEYYNIYQNLLKNNALKYDEAKRSWMGLIEGKMVPVNPRHYIIANSPAFIKNGWKYDGITRGTAMRPANSEIEPQAELIQKNGGEDAANWTTDSNEQLNIFSAQREHGPILNGIVSTRSAPDRIWYGNKHTLDVENLLGITDFADPVAIESRIPGMPNPVGKWRHYGKDMRIKAIDGNTGDFLWENRHPLSYNVPVNNTHELQNMLNYIIQDNYA